MLEIFYADILFYNLIYYQKLHGSNDFPQPDGFSGGPSEEWKFIVYRLLNFLQPFIILYL